jgi:hypothetical protein
MPYAVTFAAYTPPGRADGTPWTAVEIEEATDRTGIGATLIDTILLAPDATPENPATRKFTTEHATLAAGWYRVTWTAADGDRAPTRWVFNGANISASRRDVADLMLSRLRDDVGLVEGFSTSTRPTDVQVDRFIAHGITRVRAKLGAVPESISDDARHAVALYAAMLAESSLLPEQNNPDTGPYERLKELFDASLADLVLEVEEVGSGGEPGVVDNFATPLGLFPSSSVNFDSEPF